MRSVDLTSRGVHPSRQGEKMSETFYTSSAQVRIVEGVHRRSTLEDGTEFDMGVHGVIRSHYRLEGKELPLPVDYQVAATGG